MSGKVKCTCGWSWDKKDSSKKDMYVCHECGKDNSMKNGGWLEKFQVGGEKLTTQPLPFNTMTALKEDAKKFKVAEVTKQDRINAIRENNANWNINDYIKFGLKEPGIETPPIDPIDLIGGAIAGKALVGGVGLLKSLNVPAGAIDLMKNRGLKIAAAKSAIGGTLGGLFGTGIEIAGGTENDYNVNTKFNDGGWLSKYDDGGVQPNYNESDIEHSEDFVGMGNDITGRNYSPAWGGQFAMGGSLPGSVGFSYARTKGIPSNGPYAKKTKASAQNGKEISYDQWKKQYKLKETPDYNLKRAWELGYTPDKTGHLPTVDNQTGQFLKSKGHPTLKLELDWYNSPEGAEFKSKNTLDSTGKFFKYIPKLQNGKEMQFYQNGLDWKPKSISRDGSVIEDDRGQWDHPGEITKINSNEITMQGVDYPVLGVSDTGDTQMMQPGEDYTYDGNSVTEYPMMEDGGWLSKYDLPKAQTGEKLDFKTLMNPGIKQDATKVVRQEMMSEAEAKKFKARKDAEELARRKQAIATSDKAKKYDRKKSLGIYDPLEKLADETGAIGDRLRMFPNDPDSFIDEYINPGVMVGNIASGLGRIPLNLQEGNYGEAAMAIGVPLAFGAMEQLAAPYTSKLLRPVTQYLPEKGQVINELSNLKKAAFPNKPTLINPSEQELLSTVRNVGIMTKTGSNDAAVLEKILNKSSNLSDDKFERLVGSTRSQLEGKIQRLKEIGEPVKKQEPAYNSSFSPSSLGGDADMDAQWARTMERIRSRNPQTPEEIDNVVQTLDNLESDDAYRIRTQQRMMDAGMNIPEEYQHINLRSPQRSVTDVSEPIDISPQNVNLDDYNWGSNVGNVNTGGGASNWNWKPLSENKSLIKGLTDKINAKRYLPISDEYSESLIPTLYRSQSNNPAGEIIKAYRTLVNAPKGSRFKSASSLSTDSYPATLKMTQKALDNNLAELNYTGMGSLNTSGFSQSAGLSKDLNIKEINTMIKELNKNLKKPIPYAHYGDYDQVIAPQISLTRKKNGGWLSKYN